MKYIPMLAVLFAKTAFGSEVEVYIKSFSTVDPNLGVEAIVQRRVHGIAGQQELNTNESGELRFYEQECSANITYNAQPVFNVQFPRTRPIWKPCVSNEPISFAFVPARTDFTTAINIMSWRGMYTEVQQRAFFEPYAALDRHIQIVVDELSAVVPLRAQVTAGGPLPWDLLDMRQANADLLCDQGILLTIDHDAMLAPGRDESLPSEDFFPSSLGECFIPKAAFSNVMAFNRQMFPSNHQPTSIADFFNIESFPGKRAIQNRPMANLEWALYADGVAQEEIYEVLATPEGLERALAKLEGIKEHLVIWTEINQPPQLLAEQEVAFASGYNEQFFNAAEIEGYPISIIWDGQIVQWLGWTILADSNNLDAVMDYIYFATDSQRLADLAQYIALGPARASSVDVEITHANIDIEMEPHLPTSRENFEKGIIFDNDFWSYFADEYSERYELLMAR